MTEANSFKLVIEDDEGRRSVVPVELGEISIGRLEANTIRLNERNVSRRHARLVRERDIVFAEDLDSYNGLFVNGGRVAGRRELHAGDVIRIGDFQLELRGDALRPDRDEHTQRTHMASADTQPGFVNGRPSSEEPTVTQAMALGDEDTVEVTDVSGGIASLDDDGEETRIGSMEMTQLAEPAKLVCVSTQFAGREYTLTRAETVIGRVAENDIGIDHRSVSRQHAKIVMTQRRYKIIDMQSANGTFVNGEPYAQTELKRGDMIELGHVKLRFVPPGEDFQATTEELDAMARARTGGSWYNNKPVLLLTAAALTTALIAIAAWLMFGGGQNQDNRGPATRSETANETPHRSGNEAETLMTQARNAVAQHQFKRAQTFVNAVLALDPNREEALSVARQIEAEVKAQHSFETAAQAASQSAWSDAWNALQEIPKDSAFYPSVSQLMAQVRPALANERLSECRTAIKAEDFDDAEMELEELEGLDASHKDIPDLRQAIEEGRKKHNASGDSKRSSKPSRPKSVTVVHPAKAPQAVAPPSPPPPPMPRAQAEEAYNVGATFLNAGQFSRAIDTFTHCVSLDKNFALCYRALGIAYAKSGNGPKAVKYYKMYLKIDPNAYDAAAVRQLLQQHEPAP